MLSLALVAVVGIVVGLGYFGLRHFMALAKEVSSLFKRVNALEMIVRDDPHRAWVEEQITQQQIARQQSAKRETEAQEAQAEQEVTGSTEDEEEEEEYEQD
jgi:hypothetical protein